VKRLAFVLVALALGLMSLGSAAAAPATLPYSGFGGANGNVLESDSDTLYSGLVFALPAGGVLGSQITELSANYTVLEGDCVGGSPRYVLETAQGNVFAYFGPEPNYTNCPGGSTGNLIAPGATCDTGQLPGGTFYGECDDIDSLVVTSIYIVVDAAWAGDQAFEVFPTVKIDLGNPTSKDACKNGGHVFYGFKNQGQCIQFVNTGK
jgi:hypothetical protein